MSFAIENYELRDKMGGEFDIQSFGKSQKKIWKTPTGMFLSSDTGSVKIPDITDWVPYVLVFNQKAYELLSNYLTQYGEMLEVNIESNKYYIFNVMKMLDDKTINYDKSQKAVFEGKEVGVKRLTFNTELIDDDILIFKTSYNHGGHLYCSDKFKNLIEELKLTGITFDTMLAIDPLEGLEDFKTDLDLI